MKIKEGQIRKIIRNVLKEQSQSYFNYVRNNGLTPSEKELQTVFDKQDERTRNHRKDGKYEYQTVNPENTYAQNIFKYSTPETVNDVVKNSKKEKSLQDLHRFDGTDKEGEDREFLGWEPFSPSRTDGVSGVNGSKMRKAKMYYDMKGMNPEEKGNYLRKNFAGRYATPNGLIKESQLRKMIKEAIIKEWDSDEWDEYPRDFEDTPDCYSEIEISFNPYTLEICNKDEQSINLVIVSSDFPNAYSYCSCRGNYWNEPEYESDCGECGGEYEIYDLDTNNPEFQDIDIDEDLINQFCERHYEDLMVELTNNARFD